MPDTKGKNISNSLKKEKNPDLYLYKMDLKKKEGEDDIQFNVRIAYKCYSVAIFCIYFASGCLLES